MEMRIRLQMMVIAAKGDDDAKEVITREETSMTMIAAKREDDDCKRQHTNHLSHFFEKNQKYYKMISFKMEETFKLPYAGLCAT